MTLPTTSSTALVPTTKHRAAPWDTTTKLPNVHKSRVWQFFGHKLAELKHVTRTKSRRKLVDAIQRGSLVDVMEQLALGADVNAHSSCGETPLHIAAARGELQILTLLLERGADANVVTTEGQTPLYLACDHGHVKAVETLLQARARVDLPVNVPQGFQAIHAAAKRTDGAPIVKLLLSHGAKVDAITKPRMLTPLMLASRAGSGEVVELLLDRGADPDMEDREGNTPLHFACSEGQYRATYLLLTAGADPEMPNVHEDTPFDVASRGGYSHLTYLLETNGMCAPVENITELDHAFAQDPQLTASLARNRPEIAEVIVKHRMKYAAFYALGCIYEASGENLTKETTLNEDDDDEGPTDSDSDSGASL